MTDREKWEFYKKTLSPIDILSILARDNIIGILRVGLSDVDVDIYQIEKLYTLAINNRASDTSKYLSEIYQDKLQSLRDVKQIDYANKSQDRKNNLINLAKLKWSQFKHEPDIIYRLAYDGDLYTTMEGLSDFPNIDINIARQYAIQGNQIGTARYLKSHLGDIDEDVLKIIARQDPQILNVLRRTNRRFNQDLPHTMDQDIIDRFVRTETQNNRHLTFFNDKLDSVGDLPSYIDKDIIPGKKFNVKVWTKKGKLHRDTGPAFIYEKLDGPIVGKIEIYCRDGKLHRDKGLAFAYSFKSVDGDKFIYLSGFFINGICQSPGDMSAIYGSHIHNYLEEDDDMVINDNIRIWVQDGIPSRSIKEPTLETYFVDIYYKNRKVRRVEEKEHYHDHIEDVKSVFNRSKIHIGEELNLNCFNVYYPYLLFPMLEIYMDRNDLDKLIKGYIDKITNIVPSGDVDSIARFIQNINKV